MYNFKKTWEIRGKEQTLLQRTRKSKARKKCKNLERKLCKTLKNLKQERKRMYAQKDKQKQKMQKKI